jgi:hypothetical protein
MKRITIGLVCVILVLLSIVALGQEATVAKPAAKRPELAKEAVQTLELAVSRIENYDLKIKLLEQERDTVKGAAQQFLESLKLEGYSLVRTPQGKWEYVDAKR